MNGSNDFKNLRHQLNVWVPRILIGISILLLAYFTQRTDKFKGIFDDSFLDPANLALTRGPFAKKWYYERGEVDYQGKPLFEDEEEAQPMDLSRFEISNTPPDATPEIKVKE